MKFKDIVNRDLVNLANCEQEPIHIPGSIQPHGFLLGLKTASLTIDFCSGNSFDFIGLSHEQLLGKSFETLSGETETSSLRQYIACLNHSSESPLAMELCGKKFDCTVQAGAGVYVLEFEPVTEENIAIGNIYRQTRQFTNYMQKAATLQSLCQAVADETRAITGYDRVMIYRFDEDYNGEVFAESKIESIEPFLGLHYPHTDIPVQARELYIRNLLRLIVDTHYLPVPIYTIDDTANKNLDLSLSILRSVSPIHVRYLHNMGVDATLTISLIHEERLWGLITCHNYSPKYLTARIRIAAQLQGHFLTSQISVRQLAEEYEVAKKVNRSLDTLLEQVFSLDNITFDKIATQQELLNLTNAASVIMVVDNEIYSQSNVPPENEIKKLTNWLHTYSPSTSFKTENISLLYPDAKKWCDAVSGIIFHSLGSGPSNCIIWCRPEALQEVDWAGDPHKAIIRDEQGISPRKSFALWKEVKKCESYKWQKPEITAAANFANALQKHVHMVFLAKEELKQRQLSEKLKEANAELENINWIGSHDLKEPLRKIQLFASRILDEENEGNSANILNSVKRMNESAKRMQLLITDILSYSKLAYIEEGFKTVELSEVIEGIVNELDFEINEKQAVIEYNHLPGVKGVPFLLQQLFTNLVRNALKFSKPGTPPFITITGSENAVPPVVSDFGACFYTIAVRDNGIGFDPQFKETIFKVFTRLHNNTEYTGSGVGLALCRKIMKNHNGYIEANSEPGAGAVFYLYFPK